MNRAALAAAITLLISSAAGAHSHEGTKSHARKATRAAAEREARLKRINEKYVATIKPIFAAKCFDCHSDRTVYPWYHSIPGVKQLIDSDVAEGRKHIDMSHDFPFQGHGNPEKDLDEIGATIASGEMPPWSYRAIHWSTRLSESEEQAILAWVKESRGLLFWEEEAAAKK